MAMDRPHTPKSHLDWAGDDDDSLPDLDDWGVPSNITAVARDPEPEKTTTHVISPILQDTLKPLPTLIDIDIPTPSIRLHEVIEDTADNDLTGRPDGGDETPRDIAPPDVSELHTPTTVPMPDTRSISGNPTASSEFPTKAAASIPANNEQDSGDVLNPLQNAKHGSGTPSLIHTPVGVSDGNLLSKDSSPSPDRGLSASVHAEPSPVSTPNHLNSRPSRGGFHPSHSRAHTVGRYKAEHHSDTDRPRRGDAFSHARNHSTPPNGGGKGHPRAPHTSRPVISVDAISRLARTLGGTPVPRRNMESTVPKTE